MFWWKANHDFVADIFPGLLPVIGILVIIELVLRGMALWRSAREGRSYWFVALLLVNSAGILPAIYLLFFSNKEKKTFTKKSPKK